MVCRLLPFLRVHGVQRFGVFTLAPPVTRIATASATATISARAPLRLGALPRGGRVGRAPTPFPGVAPHVDALVVGRLATVGVVVTRFAMVRFAVVGWTALLSRDVRSRQGRRLVRRRPALTAVAAAAASDLLAAHAMTTTNAVAAIAPCRRPCLWLSLRRSPRRGKPRFDVLSHFYAPAVAGWLARRPRLLALTTTALLMMSLIRALPVLRVLAVLLMVAVLCVRLVLLLLLLVLLLTLLVLLLLPPRLLSIIAACLLVASRGHPPLQRLVTAAATTTTTTTITSTVATTTQDTARVRRRNRPRNIRASVLIADSIVHLLHQSALPLMATSRRYRPVRRPTITSNDLRISAPSRAWRFRKISGHDVRVAAVHSAFFHQRVHSAHRRIPG